MSIDAHMLVAARRCSTAGAAGDFAARVELRLDDERFRVAIADGHVEAGRGDAPGADAVIEARPRRRCSTCSTATAALADALAAGTIRIERRRARRRSASSRLFPLPLPAAA